MSVQPAIAVVVSTWSGSPPDNLVSLCRSMDRHAAGLPYDLILTANGPDYALSPRLADRFQAVFVRENVGYNLGAWDHAWRRLLGYDRFLFLQDDCVVTRRKWLTRFNQCFEDTPLCGLVGEYIPSKYAKAWSELIDPRSRSFATWEGTERVAEMTFFRVQLAQWGIPEGDSARAVTAVVQYTSRDILKLVDGYNIGRTKSEAIAAEMAFSRKVEAQGFALTQLGRYRHSVISHPQWPSDHPIARLKRSIIKRLLLR